MDALMKLINVCSSSVYDQKNLNIHDALSYASEMFESLMTHLTSTMPALLNEVCLCVKTGCPHRHPAVHYTSFAVADTH